MYVYVWTHIVQRFFQTYAGMVFNATRIWSITSSVIFPAAMGQSLRSRVLRHSRAAEKSQMGWAPWERGNLHSDLEHMRFKWNTHTHIYIDICMYGCKSNYKLPENPFRPYLCSIPLIHTLWYTHTYIYIYVYCIYIYIHISIIYIIYIIYIRVYILTHIHIYIYICIFEHVQSDSTTCVCTYIARIHTWVHTCKNTFTMPKPVIVLASLCYTCSCYLLCCVLVGMCLAAASWQSGCFLRCSRSKLPILIKMFSHRLLLSHPLRVGYGSLKFCYAGTQSTPWGPLSFTSRRWDLGDRSEELSGQLHIVASGWRWLTVLS